MKRLLIANRGEIAIRIMRTAKRMGIETVAIFSDADANAPHTRAADVAVRVGPTPATQSYLNIDNVIAAAKEAGADAIHPGYGFLSENAAFADAVVKAGITFVGPSADAMRAVGDKSAAKRIADETNVPTVPQWSSDKIPGDAYPVLVKAAAGGGGRGMRIVEHADALQAALESARREAAAGFGDDSLLVERLIRDARHVEIQIMGDAHGNCLYIGDRDCSLQRRHQKVVEEAPAPGLSSTLRIELGEAATRIASAAGYVGAGTAEFLVERDGKFWFLELNARLQVEHPVTEEVFGLDLVEWQIRVARGEALDFRQEDLEARGHAIEVRLYAEDPVTFLPTGGRVLDLTLPAAGASVRIDHALARGLNIPMAYDPMLGKLIVHASTREAARERLLDALAQVSVPGVITNAELLRHALTLPAFESGTHSIDTLEASPLKAEDLEIPAEVERAARRAMLRRSEYDPFFAASTADDIDVRVTHHGDTIWVSALGRDWQLSRSTIDTTAADGHGADAHGDRATLTAPMPGTVIKTLDPGAEVRAGEAVVVLEAMKMENAIAAPFDGTVGSVSCAVGELVARGAAVAEVER